MALIFFFCFFWTAITFNPKDIADNLKDFGSFIQGYRPNVNVVSRPTKGAGHGYSLTGHHEIMIPLLAAMLVEADSNPSS